MKAYDFPAHPINGDRHDAGIILDSFDEFHSVIPHLIRHLEKREQAVDSFQAQAIEKRKESFRAVHEQLLSGSIDDGTLEIKLTPMESESVANRLRGSEKDIVTEGEIALGGLIHSHLAHKYLEQFSIKPVNYIPLTRESVDPVAMPAL